MRNGRGSKAKDKKAGPAGRLRKTIEFNPKPIDIGRLKKLTPAENELDSYNKFVEKVADSLNLGPSGLGKRPPEIFTKAVLSQPPVQRFRKNKKPVLDSSGKPVKGLTQSTGGVNNVDVVDLTTEMVIDE